MKMRSVMFMIAAALILFCGCQRKGASAVTGNSSPGEKVIPVTSGGYVEKVDGLHVTGTPIDIDISTYRLRITGRVKNNLALSFTQVKAYKAVEKEIVLTCPGLFTDKGVWTGVPLAVLLKDAAVVQDASKVKFISEDGSYSQSLPLSRVMKGDVLVSYRFNGKEFSRVHGFPLRICVPGEAGALWVKWLGTIAVE